MEEKIKLKAKITKALGSGFFTCELENSALVRGYPSGKMRKNFIRIICGDTVDIEISKYDTSQGRIVYRYK